MGVNEDISLELFNRIPQEQIDFVFNQEVMVDIEPEFLGFVHVYKNLSELIPYHFTVVDLGCAYNAQSFLFEKHKRFIAVDNAPIRKRFLAPGTEFYNMSIEQFIQEFSERLFLEETFAICSYVPEWGANNMKLVRENFKNVFTYYPHDERHNKAFARRLKPAASSWAG